MIIGFLAIAMDSVPMGLVYAAASIVGLLIIVYSYCSKCPCRSDGCGHIVPGRITKFLPERQGQGYNFADYMGVTVPMLFILGIPQLWLWRNVSMALTFWILAAVALIEIFLKVCPGCKNVSCPFSKEPAEMG